MEESAYIGGVIAGLAYFVAGIRLYRLYLQTRQVPERLLGVALLVWGGSYFCWQLAIVVPAESLVTPLYFAGRVTNVVGCVCFAYFLRVVFRSQDRWASRLVAGIAAAFVVGIGGSFWVGDWGGIAPLRNPCWWVERVGEFAVFTWIAVEGFNQHYKARQRLALGLCEPIVCNRYLLWGLAGLFWVVWVFANIVQQIEFEIKGMWTASMDTFSGALEFSAIALIWFVFFPPQFYQRWIDRSRTASTVGEG